MDGTRVLPWTEEDIAYLRAHAETDSVKELAEKLNRTEQGILNCMTKLGCNPRAHHRWTAEDDQFIRQNLKMSRAEMAEHLGVTESTVTRRIWRLGLNRHSKNL